MNLLSDKLLKETIWAFATKFAALIGFYFLQIYLVRSMSVEMWGEWSVFWSMLVILLMVCDMGINISAKKHIAEYKGQPEFRSVLRQAFLTRVVISLLLALVFWLVSERLLVFMNKVELTYLFKYVPPLIIFFTIVEFYKASFEAFHRIKYSFFLAIAEHGGKLLVMIGLFCVWHRLDILVVGLNVAYLVTFVVGGILLWNNIYCSQDGGVAKKVIYDIWMYSLPIFFMVLCGFLSMEIDTIMISYIKGNYETGIYSAAKQLIYSLPHLSLALSMGTIPSLAKVDQVDTLDCRNKFIRLQKLNAFVILCVLFVFLCGVAPLLPFFYGEAYRPSTITLLLLLPFGFFVSHGLLTGSLLDYRGRAGRRAINLGSSVVANITLNCLLIPLWGANGAAIATSSSYSLYCFFNHIEANKEFKS